MKGREIHKNPLMSTEVNNPVLYPLLERNNALPFFLLLFLHFPKERREGEQEGATDKVVLHDFITKEWNYYAHW